MQSNHQQECLSPFWWRITENCKTKNLRCYGIINCDSISFSKERLILERVDNIDLEHLQLFSFNLYHLPGKSVAGHTMDTWLISLFVRQCYFGLITVSAKYEGLFFSQWRHLINPSVICEYSELKQWAHDWRSSRILDQITKRKRAYFFYKPSGILHCIILQDHLYWKIWLKILKKFDTSWESLFIVNSFINCHLQGID